MINITAQAFDWYTKSVFHKCKKPRQWLSQEFILFLNYANISISILL